MNGKAKESRAVSFRRTIVVGRGGVAPVSVYRFRFRRPMAATSALASVCQNNLALSDF